MGFSRSRVKLDGVPGRMAQALMSYLSLRIAEASSGAEHKEWCASIMAGSEPWITLGFHQAACFAGLERPGAELFLAFGAANEQLGFILLSPYGLAGSPYIAAIAVAESARGRGVGSCLLRFAEDRFASRRHLFLLVSSFNGRAQRLYLRQGFGQVGELPGYVVPAHSELIFHKELV